MLKGQAHATGLVRNDHFTLDKYFIDKAFFAEYLFRHSKMILPSVKKHSVKKSTRQIKKPKKTAKYIFKLWKQMSSIFTIF
jgi:hypothetical protein